MENCSHNRTKIWEPQLAGAKKCMYCGWVYNPNRSLNWYDEDAEKEKSERTEYKRLKKKFEKK